MTPDQKQRLNERARFYENLLQRKVLAPQHEAMLLMGATASQQKTAEDIVIEFTAMEYAVCGTIANMLTGLSATIAQANPEKTRAKVQDMLSRITAYSTEGLSRIATGQDSENLDVTAFRNGHIKPFDFRDHMGKAVQ